MVSLKTIKTYLHVLGCTPYEFPFQLPIWCEKIPFNRIHIGLIFALLVQNLVSTTCYRIFEAGTLGEQSQSTFFICRSVLNLVLYAGLIWNRTALTRLTTELEDVIAKSKLRFLKNIQRIYSGFLCRIQSTHIPSGEGQSGENDKYLRENNINGNYYLFIANGSIVLSTFSTRTPREFISTNLSN